MALTAVSVTRKTLDSRGIVTAAQQIPRVLGDAVAIDNGNAKGIALLQDSTPPGNAPACNVTITGDADWFWHQDDGKATSAMQKVLAGVPYIVQCTPGRTQNFYAKTATTANLIVAVIG